MLSSEERSAYFEQSVSRRHIKSFYKISSEFIKWVTSNVAKESDEYEMRVKELDAEKQLALNLMLLAQKVKGQDNFITIVK